jgi:prepilin-type N-terminal cleavage/methylation domain-containing protein/prepilin-type processing-associated H-X9-DG protein
MSMIGSGHIDPANPAERRAHGLGLAGVVAKPSVAQASRSAARSDRPSLAPAGFTLTELLVTITIIAIAVALLLPSLSMARESARRIACLNNLAQIGKAIAAYDTAQARLPGWRMPLTGYSDAPGGENVSWPVAILPYLGENEAFSWYESFATAGAADDAREKRLPRFICPAAMSAQTVAAALTYLGNGGTGAEVIRPDGQQYLGDGVFFDMVGSATYSARTATLARISEADGDAGTLLITERSGFASPTDVSWADQPLPAVANANAVVTTHLIMHPPTAGLVAGRPPTSAPNTTVNPGTATAVPNSPDWRLRYPSSRHNGGVGAVFCDGRTQFVSEKIDPWVYCQILTSDRRVLSPRATSWEVYRVGNQWVRYIFDQRDLNPRSQ